ncbi:uncharacterized protein LOC143350286 isoform X2 [Colletes latitarsis]|uniref:uncharacterized protein LOC143350286 isoform X2 n=1 Tax=Colletes latitarsis TaxID=2605962 RepID=UPI004036BA5A
MIDRLEISATLSVELTLEILCVSRALQSLEIIGEHAFRRNNPVQRSRPLACRISLTCFKVYFKVSESPRNGTSCTTKEKAGRSNESLISLAVQEKLVSRCVEEVKAGRLEETKGGIGGTRASERTEIFQSSSPPGSPSFSGSSSNR